MISYKALIISVVAAVTLQAHAAPQYTATPIHPTSSFDSLATGVSAGKAVGQLDLGLGASGDNGNPLTSLGMGIYGSLIANGVDGNLIVGTGDGSFAVCWDSLNPNPVTLPMGNMVFTVGYAVCDNGFVGAGGDGVLPSIAIYWPTGTSAPVELSPGLPGAANCLDASRIGGELYDVFGFRQAIVWDRASGVPSNLHNPLLWTDSTAQGVSGPEVAGYASDSGFIPHAMLWSGPLNVPIDLHPVSGYDMSAAWAVCNGTQVGEGFVTGTGEQHALLWTGTAASVVDLHQYVAGMGYVSSSALSVDSSGNVVGFARLASGERHAMLWKASSLVVGPFECPVNDPATPPSEFCKGSPVLLRIEVRDAQNAVVPTADLRLSVKRLSDGFMVPTSQFRLINDANKFAYIPILGEYWYLAGTAPWAKGLYEVQATVEGSGEAHATTIKIK